MSFYPWRPYVSVAQRRAKALRQMNKLRKKGHNIQPVEIEGRAIARSFWGKAWCEHLESFSDYSNRLPRGRTYARNGSICHLNIESGKIEAIVSGSELYNVTIKIESLRSSVWKTIKKKCSGQIGSMLELLQGKLSDQIMSIVTDRKNGLLPLPGQIKLSCDCPDWAVMCKHVAAVLYGIGNRLDSQPELLFTLRGVDATELIAGEIALPDTAAGVGKTIANDQIADIFDIDMDLNDEVPKKAASTSPATKKRIAKKAKTAAKQKKTFPKLRKSTKKIAAKSNLTRSNPETTNLPSIRPTGKSVARLRNRLKLSVSEFANRLDVTPASIYRWEKTSGRLKLQSLTFSKLAKLHQQVCEK